MENLKVKVANEAENKEAQSLFVSLGGKWDGNVKDNYYDKNFLYLTDGVIEYDDTENEFNSVNECKEITLKELKELVTSQCNSKLFINGNELKGCTMENFSINLGGYMKTKIEQAKSILSLNNKELSKLLGHHERYIDRVLREGVSLAQEKVIIKDIDALLKMHELQCLLAKEQFSSCRLKDELASLLPLRQKSVNDLAIAERDKRYMKRKLHDKSLVINWLLALNVFFILFLIGKCVGWV